jgi:hypothetical protein
MIRKMIFKDELAYFRIAYDEEEMFFLQISYRRW